MVDEFGESVESLGILTAFLQPETLSSGHQRIDLFCWLENESLSSDAKIAMIQVIRDALFINIYIYTDDADRTSANMNDGNIEMQKGE